MKGIIPEEWQEKLQDGSGKMRGLFDYFI